MNARTMLTVASASLALAGCAPVGGTEGELGHGEFFYQCAGTGDAACSPSDLSVITIDFATADGTEVPLAVAVGAPFDMIYQGDVTAAVARVDPAAPLLVGGAGSTFVAERAATVSFLALDASGEAVDFTDLRAEAIERVQVHDEEGAPLTSISLRVGEARRVSAVALGASGVPLAGSLTWFFSADDAVSLTGDGAGIPNANRAFVTGAHAGTTKLRITVQGVTTDVSVDVTD